MPSIYELKPRFQNLLRPLVRRLHQVGVTPNQVTILAAAGSIAVGVVLLLNAQQPACYLLLPVFLFVRMALNAIDGMLAREFGMQSKLGAFLNELGDVVSDAALYLPFGLLPAANGALVTVCVILAVIAEMAGVLGLAVAGERRYDGPMGKSDRAFVFGLIGLLVGLGVEPGVYLNWALAAITLLTLLTAINRVARSLRRA